MQVLFALFAFSIILNWAAAIVLPLEQRRQTPVYWDVIDEFSLSPAHPQLTVIQKQLYLNGVTSQTVAAADGCHIRTFSSTDQAWSETQLLKLNSNYENYRLAACGIDPQRGVNHLWMVHYSNGTTDRNVLTTIHGQLDGQFRDSPEAFFSIPAGRDWGYYGDTTIGYWVFVTGEQQTFWFRKETNGAYTSMPNWVLSTPSAVRIELDTFVVNSQTEKIMMIAALQGDGYILSWDRNLLAWSFYTRLPGPAYHLSGFYLQGQLLISNTEFDGPAMLWLWPGNPTFIEDSPLPAADFPSTETYSVRNGNRLYVTQAIPQQASWIYDCAATRPLSGCNVIGQFPAAYHAKMFSTDVGGGPTLPWQFGLITGAPGENAVVQIWMRVDQSRSHTRSPRPTLPPGETPTPGVRTPRRSPSRSPSLVPGDASLTVINSAAPDNVTSETSSMCLYNEQRNIGCKDVAWFASGVWDQLPADFYEIQSTVVNDAGETLTAHFCQNDVSHDNRFLLETGQALVLHICKWETNEKDDSSVSDTGIIVSVAIGAVVIVAGLIYFLRSKGKKTDPYTEIK